MAHFFNKKNQFDQCQTILLLLNIWPFTCNNGSLPNYIKIAKEGKKICTIMLLKMAKEFKILRKIRNFAKSGHTTTK